MATRMKVTAAIFLETENDPEDVCNALSNGLTSAIQHFPDAEVMHADVESWEPPSDDDISGYFEE